mmetsp:Transcript_20436/g.56464  ORF Transcript_20436/g.56464 Transcript_20436/m.56464 type:complete len:260 (+) Transcript_20436:837-1616(+)
MMHRNRVSSRNSLDCSTPLPSRSKILVKCAHCSSVIANGCAALISTITGKRSLGARAPALSLSNSANCRWHSRTNASLVSSWHTFGGSKGTTLCTAFRSPSSILRSSSTAFWSSAISMSHSTAWPSAVPMKAMIIMKRARAVNSSCETTPLRSVSNISTKCWQCSSVRAYCSASLRRRITGMSSLDSSTPFWFLSRSWKSMAHLAEKPRLPRSSRKSCGKKGRSSLIWPMPCLSASNRLWIFSRPSSTSCTKRSSCSLA